jgi:hypothetical protein
MIQNSDANWTYHPAPSKPADSFKNRNPPPLLFLSPHRPPPQLLLPSRKQPDRELPAPGPDVQVVELPSHRAPPPTQIHDARPNLDCGDLTVDASP